MTTIGTTTIQLIETRTEDLLREVFGDLANVTLPIDIAKIAQKYGITVYSSQFVDSAIAGLYDRDKSEIHVAMDQYLPRQLFTMGHELGHYFLHSRKIEEVFYRRDALVLGQKPKTETEADWFASALLMPRPLMLQYWEITQDIQKLAELFGVSESALRWRLVNLGLHNHATTDKQ